MSTRNQPRGDTERISNWEAALTLNGVPIIVFANFEQEVEDPQERSRAVDGQALHFDQYEEPSGSCEMFPTSPSVPQVFQCIRTKRIGSGNIVYPQGDTLGSIAFQGLRFENFSQGSLETESSYTYSADWNADFLG